MEAAVYDTLTVEVGAEGKQRRYLLRASGSSLRFPGFLVVYEETRDEDQAQTEEGENVRIPHPWPRAAPGIDSPDPGTALHPAAAALYGGFAGAT
jgi:hypothetical protein